MKQKGKVPSFISCFSPVCAKMPNWSKLKGLFTVYYCRQAARDAEDHKCVCHFNLVVRDGHWETLTSYKSVFTPEIWVNAEYQSSFVSECMSVHMPTNLLIKGLLAHPLQEINKLLAFVVILYSIGAAGVVE